MKFNLYLIQGTIPFLSEIISNVKFYPTKTNFKTPKIHTFISLVVYIQKIISVQTAHIKNKYCTQNSSSYSIPLHTVLLSSLLEIQEQFPKMKDMDKSNIRNFTLLPFFTDPINRCDSWYKRIAKNMWQNTSTETVLGHGHSEPAGHWTRSKKKTGDSIKLILYHVLSKAPRWAQRPFAPEETMSL